MDCEAKQLVACGDAGGVVNSGIGGTRRGDGNYCSEHFGTITAAMLSGKRTMNGETSIIHAEIAKLLGTFVALVVVLSRLRELVGGVGVGERARALQVVGLVVSAALVPGSGVGTVGAVMWLFI